MDDVLPNLVAAADDALAARKTVLLTIAAQKDLGPEHAEAAKAQLTDKLNADADAERRYQELKEWQQGLINVFTIGRDQRFDDGGST